MGQPIRDQYPYLPDAQTGYIDVFGDDHKNKEPILLDDGTSVWFPAGWTDEDADKWRKATKLQRPAQLRGATYNLVSKIALSS